MSDNNGFDFDNNGRTSWEEKHLTYRIERETARKNSLYDSMKKSSVSDDIRRMRNSSDDTDNGTDDKNTSGDSDGSGFGIFLLLLMVFSFIAICVNAAMGK